MSAEGGSGTSRGVLRRTLRSGSLRRVLAAYFVFNAAELATWIALLVWAYDEGGATAAGTIALVQLVPATLVAPFGAVIGDSMRRSRALALGYALQALAMAATGLALSLEAPFVVVAVCAAAAASAVTLTRPVHHAILPDLAETPEELTAANSASGTVDGVAGFVGPAISGVLLTTFGPGSVFLVMSVLLALAAAATVGLRVHAAIVPSSRDQVVASAIAGFREISHDAGAAMLVVLVGAQSVIVGLMDILIVVLALDVLDMPQSGPGWLAAAVGIGAVLGGAATVVLVGRRRLAPALAVGIVATGVPIAVLGGVSSVAPAMVLLALSGAGVAFANVAGRTLLQRSVPSEVLARIFGIQEGLMMAGLAVGAVAAPVLVEAFGSQGAFLVAGIFLPVVGMLAWTQIRRLDLRAQIPVADVALLSRLRLFAPLPQREVEQLASSLVDAAFEPGDVVIREGDVGDRFYVVRSGTLTVSQSGKAIRTLGPGDAFGEIALLRQIPRTATVTADSAVDLGAVDRDDFLASVTGTPRALLEARTVIRGHLEGDAERSDPDLEP